MRWLAASEMGGITRSDTEGESDVAVVNSGGETDEEIALAVRLEREHERARRRVKRERDDQLTVRLDSIAECGTVEVSSDEGEKECDDKEAKPGVDESKVPVVALMRVEVEGEGCEESAREVAEGEEELEMYAESIERELEAVAGECEEKGGARKKATEGRTVAEQLQKAEQMLGEVEELAGETEVGEEVRRKIQRRVRKVKRIVKRLGRTEWREEGTGGSGDASGGEMLEEGGSAERETVGETGKAPPPSYGCIIAREAPKEMRTEDLVEAMVDLTPAARSMPRGELLRAVRRLRVEDRGV